MIQGVFKGKYGSLFAAILAVVLVQYAVGGEGERMQSQLVHSGNNY